MPIQGLTFLILVFLLKIHRPRTPLKAGLIAIDWPGVVLAVGGIIILLLGLQFGGAEYPWDSATVLCLIIFGILALALFAINEYMVRYPLIPLHIFEHRSNVACFVVCFCHGFTYIGGSFYLPFYFQSVLGHTPIISGVLFLASVVSLSLTSIVSGLFIRKTGHYLPPIWFGMSFLTLGFGLYLDFGTSPFPGYGKIIGYQIIAGLGIGSLFQSLLIALQSLVPQGDIASAVATFQLVRNIATSMSVIIGSVVFQNAMKKRMNQLVVALGAQTAQQLAAFQAAASAQFVRTLPLPQRTVAERVIAESLHDMWIMYVAVAGVGLFTSFAITKQLLSKKHKETKTGLEAEEIRRKEREERKRLRGSSKQEATKIDSIEQGEVSEVNEDV